ncbi:hypothetical protein DB44_DO00030 [Candidatus Protochlamydia amoebophila]|uniref:Uncharacterized protein n=1 Tax=Candidatus Protochlamydia amoebophila TaxID=362787 RepID=A0A0C1JJB7_9BACT|nr:hypothetical protein DB44_DO00030 [Candidatus Protochlamydia amoebophila]
MFISLINSLLIPDLSLIVIFLSIIFPIDSKSNFPSFNFSSIILLNKSESEIFFTISSIEQLANIVEIFSINSLQFFPSVLSLITPSLIAILLIQTNLLQTNKTFSFLPSLFFIYFSIRPTSLSVILPSKIYLFNLLTHFSDCGCGSNNV